MSGFGKLITRFVPRLSISVESMDFVGVDGVNVTAGLKGYAWGEVHTNNCEKITIAIKSMDSKVHYQDLS